MIGGPVPWGCLGCNTEACRAALEASGLEPSRFIELPPYARFWAWNVPPIGVCRCCSRAWWVVFPNVPWPGRVWS